MELLWARGGGWLEQLGESSCLHGACVGVCWLPSLLFADPGLDTFTPCAV